MLRGGQASSDKFFAKMKYLKGLSYAYHVNTVDVAAPSGETSFNSKQL